MKIILSWLYDHLDPSADRVTTAQDIHEFAGWYSTHVSEVAHISHHQIPLETWYLAQITNRPHTGTHTQATAWISELRTEIVLSIPDIAQIGAVYVITRDSRDGWRLVTSSDIGLMGSQPLAHVLARSEVQNGAWRNSCDHDFWIFEFDNISLTHRPDLWGHRGHAREALGYLKGALRPVTDLITLSGQPLQNNIPSDPLTSRDKFSRDQSCKDNIPSDCAQGTIVSRDHTLLCTVGATIPADTGIYLPWTLRLAQLGIKSHRAAIDVTNYTMADWGYPLHMFDSDKLTGSPLIARHAHATEQVTLLDHTTIKLTPQDIIIADSSGPLSLAGIMGRFIHRGNRSDYPSGSRSWII